MKEFSINLPRCSHCAGSLVPVTKEIREPVTNVFGAPVGDSFVGMALIWKCVFCGLTIEGDSNPSPLTSISSKDF